MVADKYNTWDRERELQGGAHQNGADMLTFQSGCGGPPKYEYCGQCGGVLGERFFTMEQCYVPECTVCGHQVQGRDRYPADLTP